MRDTSQTNSRSNPPGSPYFLAGLGVSGLLLPFFMPTRILPFLPLLSWSFALQWYIDEYQFHSSWSKIPSAHITPAHDEILGQWFQQWFPLGGRCAAITTPLVWASSLLTLYQQRHSSWEDLVPVALGFGLTVYHVIFGNDVYGSYKRMGEGKRPETDGGNLRDLRKWAQMQKRRILWIDVPAWVSFALVAYRNVF